jgi:hypothetical protein
MRSVCFPDFRDQFSQKKVGAVFPVPNVSPVRGRPMTTVLTAREGRDAGR